MTRLNGASVTNRSILLILSAGLAVLLASCATLSESQCQAGNWRAVGFEDGTQGRLPSYASNHANACAEYGIVVDGTLYDQGRTEGLASYCQLLNAERIGRDGRPYRGVCTGEQGVSFGRVYSAAQKIHEANAQINSLDGDIDRIMRQLRQSVAPHDNATALTRQLLSLQRERRSVQLLLRTLETQLLRLRVSEQARLEGVGIAG